MMDVQVAADTTIRQVLEEVTRRYPVLDKFIWKDKDELAEVVHVFINGENIHRLDGLDTLLTEEDHVDIFPPVVGG